MTEVPVVEVAPGLWELRALHPEWTEGEADGWEPEVAWRAVASDAGLLLIDPLITGGWDWVDAQVQRAGGCAGIVRTICWHQRSVLAARARYGAEIWARAVPDGKPAEDVPSDCSEPDRLAGDGEVLAGGAAVVHWLSNGDELAVWLPGARALVFGDAMIRDGRGRLQRAPADWSSPRYGAAQLNAELKRLATELEPRHLLVSHGPLVVGDGPEALLEALA